MIHVIHVGLFVSFYVCVCVGVENIEGCESDSAVIDGQLWPARACLKIFVASGI